MRQKNSEEFDSLAHHGILGMKWGVRRFQNEDGSLTNAGRKRYSDGPVDAKAEAKALAKREKMENKMKAAREYSKTYNEASSLEDKSDKLYAEAKEKYKSLGKTPLSRIKEVIKAQKGKGSDAANEYLKKMEESEDLADKAYDKWTEAKKQYKSLGKTYIERVLTVAKSDNWDPLSDYKKSHGNI